MGKAWITKLLLLTLVLGLISCKEEFFQKESPDGSSCLGMAEGTEQKANFYEKALVRWDQQCIPVEQSRVCSGGKWGAWSGNLTITSCQVQERVLIDQVDNFVQNQAQTPKVDILWVIDNSGSLGDEQDALAANFSSFIDKFIERNVDFKMAITTTDAYWSRNPVKWVCPDKNLDAAAAASNQAKFISDFQECVHVGTGGASVEKGFDSSLTFLNLYKDSFLRPNAYLVMVMLSDEEEQSSVTVSNFVDYIAGLKGGRDKLKIYSIVTLNAEDVQVAPEAPGTRYIAAADLTGGTYSSIHADFATTLESIGAKIVNLQDSFTLSKIPLDNNIVVKVNGSVWASGWTYNSVGHSVKFDGIHLPPEGAQIDIIYKYDATPPIN
jgi:hypothetical protein